MTGISEHEAMRRDALQEVLNISMGQAANNLAQLIDTRVHLSIPRLHWVSSKHPEKLDETLTVIDVGALMRQSFRGTLRGEVIVSFDQQSRHHQLAECLGYSESLTVAQSHELTLEITNILAGACLKGLAEQLEIEIHFGPPSILSAHSKASDYLARQSLPWTDALFMEVRFTVESISMGTDLLICMPGEYTDRVFALIDELLGDV